MRVTLDRSGDGLALQIPQSLVDELRLTTDSEAELRLEGDRLILERIDGGDELARLVAGITDENRHEAVDWGPPRGKEAW